jgi:hypothetical protein
MPGFLETKSHFNPIDSLRETVSSHVNLFNGSLSWGFTGLACFIVYVCYRVPCQGPMNVREYDNVTVSTSVMKDI